MQSPIPLATKSKIPPTMGGTPGFNFVCLTGTVNLFQFFAPPPPGSVIGRLLTASGPVPLVQSAPALSGGPPLATVDRQVATVCGNLTVIGNQVALDVRFVLPGGGHAFPGINPLLLFLLFGKGFGKGGKGFGKGGKGFGKPPFHKGGKGFGKPPFQKPFGPVSTSAE